MKLFESGNIELVNDCQMYFGIDLHSCVFTKRQDKFIVRYKYAANPFASLARTASLCRRAYILSCGFFFVFFHSFFFLYFPLPKLWGYWTDINQTWTHTHLWLLFEKFGPNSPGHLTARAGGKNRYFGTDFELWPNIFATKHDINNRKKKKLDNLQGLPYMPRIWWTLVQKRLRTVGEFLPTPKFSHWETLPALPHGRYVTDIRQSFARIICSGTSLQSRTTECRAASRLALPCI